MRNQDFHSTETIQEVKWYGMQRQKISTRPALWDSGTLRPQILPFWTAKLILWPPPFWSPESSIRSLGKGTYHLKQWPALSTCLFVIIAPPQCIRLFLRIATVQGNEWGSALRPPTILTPTMDSEGLPHSVNYKIFHNSLRILSFIH